MKYKTGDRITWKRNGFEEYFVIRIVDEENKRYTINQCGDDKIHSFDFEAIDNNDNISLEKR